MWERCRSGAFEAPTPGLAPGHAQANVVLVPAAHAFDFLRFALRNPRQAPLLDVGAAGGLDFPLAAPGCDLYTDLPRYLVWREGRAVEEVRGAVA